jgi:beta-xylosidase-like protein
LNPRSEWEKFGFIVMGFDYSYVGVAVKGGKLYVARVTAKDADKLNTEYEDPPFLLKENTLYLRSKVTAGAVCSFSYSVDGAAFTNLGVPFTAREGRWIEDKIGFFFTRSGKFNDAGSADIDWFRVEK